METVTIPKSKYFELLDIKERLNRILAKDIAKEATFFNSKKDAFLDAFGALKYSFKGRSVDYVNKIRKEWRILLRYGRSKAEESNIQPNQVEDIVDEYRS